jgi:hypothetical protein
MLGPHIRQVNDGWEDTVAAAQKDRHDKIMSHWEQARAGATATTEKVNQQIQSVGDSVAKDLPARKTKIAPDLDALKAKVVQKKRELERGTPTRPVRHDCHPIRGCWNAIVGSRLRVSQLTKTGCLQRPSRLRQSGQPIPPPGNG